MDIQLPKVKIKGQNMKFDIDYIEKLTKVLTDSSLTEISVEDGDQAVTIRKESNAVATVAASPVISSVTDNAVKQTESHKGKAITSPIVGTFYSAPSPDSEPFVKIGQEIEKGTKVCIIEAMKLMNEIESEFDGKITEICVSDGQPVEFGQVLMYVE